MGQARFHCAILFKAPGGVEPSTYSLLDWHSNQLSYGAFFGWKKGSVQCQKQPTKEEQNETEPTQWCSIQVISGTRYLSKEGSVKCQKNKRVRTKRNLERPTWGSNPRPRD